jgi:hypothetical protein
MSITAENMQFEKGTIVTHENGVRASDVSVPPRWLAKRNGSEGVDKRIGRGAAQPQGAMRCRLQALRLSLVRCF